MSHANGRRPIRAVVQSARCSLYHGDSARVADVLGENSVDAIVTDPPAGIGFLNHEWDHDKGGRDQWISWLAGVLRAGLRVLKPGGHALVWALPRTSHWTGMAIELAGFEIRDVHHHLFGTGFPKSMNISKAIDARNGVRGRVIGVSRSGASALKHYGDEFKTEFEVTVPQSRDAKRWQGWSTALKPAVEHWILARKPLSGGQVDNILKHGTGALNTDACRISYGAQPTKGTLLGGAVKGRWPAHLSLEHATACGSECVLGCPVRMLDDQSGKSCASGFFYNAKPPRSEKDAGLPKGRRNHHPTVKSVALMRWLIRLITPPNGVVLDPFAGSGTTGVAAIGEGCRFVGMERKREYAKIAAGRLQSEFRRSGG